MFSGSNLTLVLVLAGVCAFAETPQLRVCADPNNLPFSNQQGQGFENELAQMIANDLGMQVAYTWFAQRGSFFRRTVGAGECDVVMGVPEGMKKVATTRPYYRSSYVFVARHDRGMKIHSLDDPRLAQLRIGVHVLGDSDRSSPPVQMLIAHGLVDNLVAFNIFGNMNEPNPPSDLIKAVANGSVDVAVAWGPMAGYFAHHANSALDVTIIDDPSNPSIPLSFDIAVGVRPQEVALKQKIDSELDQLQPKIDQLLESYAIPLRKEN